MVVSQFITAERGRKYYRPVNGELNSGEMMLDLGISQHLELLLVQSGIIGRMIAYTSAMTTHQHSVLTKSESSLETKNGTKF